MEMTMQLERLKAELDLELKRKYNPFLPCDSTILEETSLQPLAWEICTQRL